MVLSYGSTRWSQRFILSSLSRDAQCLFSQYLALKGVKVAWEEGSGVRVKAGFLLGAAGWSFYLFLFCFVSLLFFFSGGGWGRAERLVFPVLFPAEYARNVNENYSDCHYIKIVKENKYICQAIFFNSYKQLLR